ncbi:Uncharacterised protein [Vibrio cholerae]|nr:Uncharacterised protein [Vibrio cholerae]
MVQYQDKRCAEPYREQSPHGFTIDTLWGLKIMQTCSLHRFART